MCCVNADLCPLSLSSSLLQVLFVTTFGQVQEAKKYSCSIFEFEFLFLVRRSSVLFGTFVLTSRQMQAHIAAIGGLRRFIDASSVGIRNPLTTTRISYDACSPSPSGFLGTVVQEVAPVDEIMELASKDNNTLAAGERCATLLRAETRGLIPPWPPRFLDTTAYRAASESNTRVLGAFSTPTVTHVLRISMECGHEEAVLSALRVWPISDTYFIDALAVISYALSMDLRFDEVSQLNVYKRFCRACHPGLFHFLLNDVTNNSQPNNSQHSKSRQRLQRALLSLTDDEDLFRRFQRGAPLRWPLPYDNAVANEIGRARSPSFHERVSFFQLQRAFQDPECTLRGLNEELMWFVPSMNRSQVHWTDPTRVAMCILVVAARWSLYKCNGWRCSHGDTCETYTLGSAASDAFDMAIRSPGFNASKVVQGFLDAVGSQRLRRINSQSRSIKMFLKHSTMQTHARAQFLAALESSDSDRAGTEHAGQGGQAGQAGRKRLRIK